MIDRNPNCWWKLDDQSKTGKLLRFEDVDWQAVNKKIHEAMEVAFNEPSILAEHFDKLRRLTR